MRSARLGGGRRLARLTLSRRVSSGAELRSRLRALPVPYLSRVHLETQGGNTENARSRLLVTDGKRSSTPDYSFGSGSGVEKLQCRRCGLIITRPG